MKPIAAFGITLLILVSCIWIMAKLSAGNGIQINQMDPTQPYQVEWVMQQEEDQQAKQGEEEIYNFVEMVDEIQKKEDEA